MYSARAVHSVTRAPAKLVFVCKYVVHPKTRHVPPGRHVHQITSLLFVARCAPIHLSVGIMSFVTRLRLRHRPGFVCVVVVGTRIVDWAMLVGRMGSVIPLAVQQATVVKRKYVRMAHVFLTQTPPPQTLNPCGFCGLCWPVLRLESSWPLLFDYLVAIRHYQLRNLWRKLNPRTHKLIQ